MLLIRLKIPFTGYLDVIIAELGTSSKRKITLRTQRGCSLLSFKYNRAVGKFSLGNITSIEGVTFTNVIPS